MGQAVQSSSLFSDSNGSPVSQPPQWSSWSWPCSPWSAGPTACLWTPVGPGGPLWSQGSRFCKPQPKIRPRFSFELPSPNCGAKDPPHLCSWAATNTDSMMSRRASEICLALTVCCSNLVFTADWEMHSCRWKQTSQHEKHWAVSGLNLHVNSEWFAVNEQLTISHINHTIHIHNLPQISSQSFGIRTFWLEILQQELPLEQDNHWCNSLHFHVCLFFNKNHILKFFTKDNCSLQVF